MYRIAEENIEVFGFVKYQRDIAIAFDFVEQILDNPDMLDKIPDGASITFLDDENIKLEKSFIKDTA